jgi:hypothetical protein
VRYLLGLLVAGPPVLLAVGAVRGRVQVRPCCPAPEHDTRLVGVLDDPAGKA